MDIIKHFISGPYIKSMDYLNQDEEDEETNS